MPFLDIRAGEGRKVSLLLLHSFCNGVSLSVLISAAPSLFLEHFGAAALPYCYMASAVVVPSVGYAYMRLAGKLNLRNLLTANLAFLLVGLVLLRWLFIAGFDRVAAGMMVTWVDVQVVMLGLEFDAVTGTLFDLRQSKRVFPIIGTGEVVAGILGGLGVPLIAPLIGAKNLLWVSILGLLGALCILKMLKPGAVGSQSVSACPEHSSSRSKSPSRKLGPLSIALILTAALADMASYFGDNIFYTQVSARYQSPEQMAGFIGIYLACAGGLALLMRLTVTPMIYQRFGISVGLMVGPVVTFLVATTLCLVMGGWLPPVILIFWTAACLKLNDDVHRKSNHRTGLFLMLQALPVGDRIRTQTIQEGMVGSMIGGLAGGLLLLLNRVSPMAAPSALAIIAFFWTSWLLRVRKPYVETVAGSLRRQLILSRESQILDSTSRKLLQSYLQGNDPALILYAVHSLGNDGVDEQTLGKLLRHEFPEIRIEAARICTERVESGLMGMVEEAIKREGDPRVLAGLIRACFAMSPSAGQAIAREHMQSENVQVRRHALAGIFKQGIPVVEAMDALAALSGSADPLERLAAVKVIEETSGDAMATLLLERLADGDQVVRRAAARASAGFPYKAVASRLVELLGDSFCQQDSVTALRHHGDIGVRLILSDWRDRSSSRFKQAGMIRVLGYSKNPESLALLWQILREPDFHRRGMVLEVLASKSAIRTEEQANLLRMLFHGDVARARKAWEFLAVLPTDAPLSRLLAASIAEDRKSALRRALDALWLLYPGSSFAMAKPHLLEPADPRMGLALETVENLLSLEDRDVLVPALLETQQVKPAGENAPGPGLVPFAEYLEGMPLTETGFLSLFSHFLGIVCLSSVDPERAPRLLFRRNQLLQRLSSPLGLLPGLTARESGPFLERLALFNRLSIFEDVALSSLAQVVRKAECRSFSAGESIIRMGDAGESLFVVTQGRVRVHRKDVAIDELSVGAIVGEMSALDPKTPSKFDSSPTPELRVASVTALEPVIVLELDRSTLLDLMRSSFDLSKAMMRMLARRLRHVNS